MTNLTQEQIEAVEKLSDGPTAHIVKLLDEALTESDSASGLLLKLNMDEEAITKAIWVAFGSDETAAIVLSGVALGAYLHNNLKSGVDVLDKEILP